MPEKQYYTIGQVMELLRLEFPEISPSSLRYLEKEGLLRPERTQGGHRLYSDEDIARIRLTKRLQAQRYYPLETIRHMLTKLEQTKDVEAEIAFLESLYTPISYDANFTPLTREQLAERSGLAPANISRLEEMGMLFPQSNGNGRRYYDEDDLKVAELVARELRHHAHLEDFANLGAAMRALVQEEFRLYFKLAGPDTLDSARAQQLKGAADLVHTILRAKLYRQMMMREKSGPSSDRQP